MRKLSALLAAVCAAAMMLASCENVSLPEESSGRSVSSRDMFNGNESLLPSPPDESGSTEVQKITVLSEHPGRFLVDDETPQALTGRLHERNAYIESVYGADIQTKSVNYDTAAQEIRAAMQSGEYGCEILALSAGNTAKLWSEGLLYDMRELSGFDIGSSVFEQGKADSLATNKSVYMLPDDSTYYFDEIGVFFCNRDLLDASLPDPEQLCIDGKWTWDRFAEHCRASYNISESSNRYGYGYYTMQDYVVAFWDSAGKPMIKDTNMNPVRLAMSSGEMQQLSFDLFKYWNVRYKYDYGEARALKQFRSNDALFLWHRLGYFRSLRDGAEEGLNYFVLPMPKFDESQEGYSSLVGRDALVYSLPANLAQRNSKTKTRVLAILMVNCAAGANSFKRAYVGSMIADYLVNNNETLVMQEIVDSATFDFAYVFSPVAKPVRDVTTYALEQFFHVGSYVGATVDYGLKKFEEYSDEHFK